MTHYQLTHLDLSTRMELGLQMLNPQRVWGEATQLAHTYGVSRKFLYGLRKRTEQSLQASLAPHPVGREANAPTLRVDQQLVRRAILVLSVLPPSIRNLQLAVKLLLGQHCSVGFIQQTLRVAGQRAQAENQSLHPVRPIQGEADEIYKTGQPCLTVLDGRSLLVLNLAHQDDCDRTTWGVTLLELQQQGVCFEDIALDGSLNLRAGIGDAALDCPLRPDLFHLFQEGCEISRKLKWAVGQAHHLAQQGQKADEEAKRGKRFRGRPRRKPLGISSAQAQEQLAQITRQYELWIWLFGELHQTLQLIHPHGQLCDPVRARQELELIGEWMQTLTFGRIAGFARNVLALSQELLAPLERCVQRLAPWRQKLDAQWDGFVFWAWKHRQALQVDVERDFPAALQPVVQAIWHELANCHRTSSLAEALHSWLRPFLELHRGMPDWLLAILQAFWNHHPFQRGLRQGHSPLSLAGIVADASLGDWLEHLLAPIQVPALPSS